MDRKFRVLKDMRVTLTTNYGSTIETIGKGVVVELIDTYFIDGFNKSKFKYELGLTKNYFALTCLNFVIQAGYLEEILPNKSLILIGGKNVIVKYTRTHLLYRTLCFGEIYEASELDTDKDWIIIKGSTYEKKYFTVVQQDEADGVWLIEYSWKDYERDSHKSTLDSVVFRSEEKAQEYCNNRGIEYNPKFVNFMDL